MNSDLLSSAWSSWHLGLTRNVSLWADTYRQLPRGTSQYPGAWKTERFPYLRGPMDSFSNPKVRLIVLKWATQLGKTECQLNMLGYCIDEQPGPILVVYPNESISRKVSETRIAKMINATPRLKDKMLPESKLLQYSFMDGTTLYLASAQVPADLASMPIQYLFADEVGKFPQFSGKEGDPIGLAMERLKAFSYTSKTVLVSSPTTEDGPISRYYDTCAEQLTYWIPCPHCQTLQTLDFGQIKWDLGDLRSHDPAAWRHVKKTASYQCPHCLGMITHQHKVNALSHGKWLRDDGHVPDHDSESVGYRLSSLYSPLLTWGVIAAEFLQVKDDPPRLMVYRNCWLCQEWQDLAIVKKEPSMVLMSNRNPEHKARTAPKDTLALVMGLDSQSAGFYFVVRAWSRDRTSHLIDYGFFPSLQDITHAVMDWSYPVAGTPYAMGIWRAAIDTGGTRLEAGPSMTEQIYHWLRRQPGGVIYGIKGSSWKTGIRVQHKIIDKMPGTHGTPIPGGITLFLIDTAAFKEALHYRLNIPAADPGAFLFHAETSEDYAEQLLSEYKRRETRTGKESWVPIAGRENHYLDCEIYAMAATDTQFLGGLDALTAPVRLIGAPKKSTLTPDPPIEDIDHRPVIKQGKKPWMQRRPKGWLK